MTPKEIEARKQEIREAIRDEQEARREAREQRMPEQAVPSNVNQETR